MSETRNKQAKLAHSRTHNTHTKHLTHPTPHTPHPRRAMPAIASGLGKNADLLVVKGDPAVRIADIENIEIVFKGGVGYDPGKLLDSGKGHYGEY